MRRTVCVEMLDDHTVRRALRQPVERSGSRSAWNALLSLAGGGD